MQMATHLRESTHSHLFSSPEFDSHKTIAYFLRLSILRYLIVEEMLLIKFKMIWKGRLKEGIKQNKMDWIMWFSPQTVCKDQFHPGEPRKILIISSTQGHAMEYSKETNYHVQSVFLRYKETPLIALQLLTETLTD